MIGQQEEYSCQYGKKDGKSLKSNEYLLNGAAGFDVQQIKSRE